MKTCIVLPSSKIFQASKSHEWTARWINHGVGLLIAYCKKQGFQVDLIDTRRLKDWEEYKTAVKDYDVVCFSVNTVDFKTYQACLAWLKVVNPKSKVIVGGVHPTIKLEDFNNDSNVDYIIQKEGESALTYLLHCIRGGVRDINRVTVGTPVNLDSIPFIDRGLWLPEYPWGLNFSGKEPFVTILTSRACTSNCSFCQPCSRTMFGADERRRSVENVIAELVELDRIWGFRSWMIHDDGFIQNIEWVKQFIKQYKEKIGNPRPFIIQSRANYPIQHEDIIKQLKEIGLEMVIVGFESGSDKVLKILRKGTTREINIRGAKIFHANGIKIFANIMMGAPGETNSDVLETMSMVRAIKPEHFSVATYSPYPGNDLHDTCHKEGLILTEYASRFPGEQKIKGIDYAFIQKQIDLYNQEQNKIKYWLKHTNLPLANTARQTFRSIRAKVT